MSFYLPLALIVGLVAALVTHLVTPLVARTGELLRNSGVSGNRQRQRRQDSPTAIPRLGGVAIAFGIVAGVASLLLLLWRDWQVTISRAELLALAAGTGLVFLVGLVDDLVGASVTQKFLTQILAAAFLLRIGWTFEVLTLPFAGQLQLGFWGYLLSLLWIVGVTNAINLLDGLDGLASGVVAIVALSLLAVAALQGNPAPVLLLAVVAGACLGFLRHNWAPATIFMGDSGSLSLGFLLAGISLHASLKSSATVAILVPVLALGLPVIDTLLVMLARFSDTQSNTFAGRFLGMFRGDRQHLHFLLSPRGDTRPRIVGVIYAVALAFCLLALAVAVSRSVNLGLLLLAVEVVAVVAIRRLGSNLGSAKRA